MLVGAKLMKCRNKLSALNVLLCHFENVNLGNDLNASWFNSHSDLLITTCIELNYSFMALSLKLLLLLSLLLPLTEAQDRNQDQKSIFQIYFTSAVKTKMKWLVIMDLRYTV